MRSWRLPAARSRSRQLLNTSPASYAQMFVCFFGLLGEPHSFHAKRTQLQKYTLHARQRLQTHTLRRWPRQRGHAHMQDTNVDGREAGCPGRTLRTAPAQTSTNNQSRTLKRRVSPKRLVHKALLTMFLRPFPQQRCRYSGGAGVMEEHSSASAKLAAP